MLVVRLETVSIVFITAHVQALHYTTAQIVHIRANQTNVKRK